MNRPHSTGQGDLERPDARGDPAEDTLQTNLGGEQTSPDASKTELGPQQREAPSVEKASAKMGLKRNRAYSVSFRATVGKEASEMALVKKDSYLATLVRKHFDVRDMPWGMAMSEEEKARYRENRAEIEGVKKLIIGWKKAWESGHLQGHDGAAPSSKRVRGAGPPLRTGTLEELLTRYYLKVTVGQKMLCTKVLMKIKAAQLAEAARSEGSEEVANGFLEDGKVNMAWVDSLVKRWMARSSLRTKAPTNKVKLMQPEMIYRVHVFFRNLTRVRAAYPALELQVDAYDHTPFFRRMATGEGLGVPGVRLESNENTSDSRTRFTVVVPSSTDCTAQNPTVLFKAKAPEGNKDFEKVAITAGRRVYLQYNSSPSFNEETTIQLLKHQYAHPNVQEFTLGAPRILVFDQFTGQMTEKCIREMVKHRKIPLVIWGGLTSLLQPADLYQIKNLKAL